MKKTSIILLILLLVFQIYPVSVQASATAGCHTLQADRALAGNERYTGSAKAVILYEMNTQTLVYAHNPDEAINPTGLIKLLSALIVLEEGNLDDIVSMVLIQCKDECLGQIIKIRFTLRVGEHLRID